MGSNLTYQGKLELLVNRPKEVLEGWRPEERSTTELGEQLVCVALYWLSKNVIETSKNSGQYIDLFKQDYFGKDAASQKQAAYCAVFAWFLMNEATKNMGCTHKFPGATEVWANAKNTLLKAEKIYNSDLNNPTVGSLMFRYSTDSNSSGHWGLVVNVDKKNQTFDTVEGNVVINKDGTKEGVACWRYRFDDIKQSNGIKFVHVEQETTCKNAKAKSYKGFECRPISQQVQNTSIAEGLPKCIRKVNNTYMYFNESNQAMFSVTKGSDNKWYTSTAKGWIEVTNCDYKSTPVVSNTPTPPKKEEKVYSPVQDTSTPVVEKVKKCKNTIVSVPAKSKLQHFEVLRDPKVIADITDANIGSEAARFGSALWYNRSDINPGSNTGFGMFRDSISNLIYVLDADQPQSQQIMKNGFLGFTMDSPNVDENILFVNRRAGYYNGGGWKEKFANDLVHRSWKFGNISNVNDLVEGGALVFMPPASNLNKVLDWSKVPGQNLISYLREIENKGTPLDKPIIIYISERGTPPSAVGQLKKVLSVVSAVSGVIGIPIPPEILKNSEALIAIAEGRASIKDIANNLVMLAEYFAPEYVKDANNLIGSARKEVGSYLKQAENIFGSVINSQTFESLNNLSLNNIQASLGLDKGEVGKLLTRYTGGLGINTSTPDLTKILKGFDLNKVAKVVENTTNVLMLDTVRRELNGGRLSFNIANEANPIRSIPVLQDLFIAGGSNAAFGAFPGIEDFTREILNNQSVINLIGESENSPEMIASLIGNNFGSVPVDKSIMKNFQIEALIGKAFQTDINTPFALPQSVEDEYKECYKFIIEQESDRKVLWCPDGWEWDHNLRKCVNKTVSSGYTNTGTSNSNVTGSKVITGTTPVKTNSSNSSTKSDTFIPNDWNYFGDIPTNFIQTDLPNNGVKIKAPAKIPPCVVVEGNEYFFYPNKAKQTPKIVYETKPKTEVSVPTSIETNQIIRTDFVPKEFVSLPGGIVSIPTNTGLHPSNGFHPDPLPLPILPIGLNDSIMPDKIRVYVSNIGTDKEAWFVRIDGILYDFNPWTCQIIGYDPNKKVEIKIPEKIVVPEESKEAEKINQKYNEQIKELEAKLALESEARKRQENQPDERVITMQQELEKLKLQNQQKESFLLAELKKVSEAKNETSPELIDQLRRSEDRIAELTRIVNEQNKPVESPNQEILKEISLLKSQLETEKKRETEIQTATPQVQKAVSECTDCDIAKLPSRVVNITEYGSHHKRCSQCNNECSDCDCGECY